jgi:hypothetical protein
MQAFILRLEESHNKMNEARAPCIVSAQRSGNTVQGLLVRFRPVSCQNTLYQGGDFEKTPLPLSLA